MSEQKKNNDNQPSLFATEKPKKIKYNNKAIISEINKHITILDLVPEFKNGRVGCFRYPHRKGTAPSVEYNVEEDYWNCHKCRDKGVHPAGGNVINLYAVLNNIDYGTALTELCEKYKIKHTKQTKEDGKKYDLIDKIFTLFMKYCHANLVGEREYYNYVKNKRNYNDKTIKDNKLGLFNENVKGIIEDLFTKKELFDAGFLNQEKQWLFKTRIIYPYLTETEKCKYLFYRKVDFNPDKYIDKLKHKLKNTPLKNYIEHIIFGLRSIRKIKSKKILIISEGPADALSIAQTGIPSITNVMLYFSGENKPKAIKICKQYEKVYVIYDHEEDKKLIDKETGEEERVNHSWNASLKIAKELHKYGINAYIGRLPLDNVNTNIKEWKIDWDEHLLGGKTVADQKKIIINVLNAALPIKDFLLSETEKEYKNIKELTEQTNFLDRQFKKIINIIPKENVSQIKMVKTFFKEKFSLQTREANAIIKNATLEQKTYEIQIAKTMRKELLKNKKCIPYDKLDIIKSKKGIILRNSYIDEFGKEKHDDQEILNTNFELLYKVKEEYGENIYRYIFKVGEDMYFPKTPKEILAMLEPQTLKGPLGRDVMKKVILSEAVSIDEIEPQYIIGWDDGWKLPQTQEKLGMRIMSYTDYQKKIEKRIVNIIKIYSEDDKKQIYQKMQRFIDITEIDKDKLAIILGWCLISVFRIDILTYFKTFPILYLYGPAESGKTSELDLHAVDFYKAFAKHLSSTQIGNAAKLEDWLSTSTFPVFISEVEKIKDPDIVNIIKDHAVSTSLYTRKQSSIASFERPKTAPLVLDGNIFPEKFKTEAVVSRMIILNIDNHIIQNDEWLKLERELSSMNLFSLLYDFTKDDTKKTLFNNLEALKVEFMPKIKNKTHKRIIAKYIIMIAGIRMFNNIFKTNLPTENVFDTLVSEEIKIYENFVDMFRLFCFNALIFKVDQYGITRQSKKYLTSQLYERKDGDYIFTHDNLGDFNNFAGKVGKEKYTLREAENNAIMGLPLKEKHFVELKKNRIPGLKNPIWSIYIKKEFLKIVNPDDENDENDENMQKTLKF